MISEFLSQLVFGPPLYRHALTFFTGITSHQLILRPFAVDDHFFQVFLFFTLSPLALTTYLTLSPIFNLPLSHAILATISISTLHILGIFFSCAIYRLFFHPLRHIPGPLGCKLSGWYSFYLAQKSGLKFHVLTQQWHERYGKVVRTNPNFVSVNSKAIVPILSQSKKGSHYLVGGFDGSLQSTRDVETHRLRRKAWDKAFTARALERYTITVAKQCSVFVRRLLKVSRKKEPVVDVATLLMRYTFEMMGYITFTKRFGLLSEDDDDRQGLGEQEKKEEDEGEEDLPLPNPKLIARNKMLLDLSRHSMEIVGMLLHVPYMFLLAVVLPATPYEKFIQWCWEEVKERWGRVAELEGKDKDIFGWLHDAEPLNVPPHKIALDQDARLAIVAGTDTTAAALTSALFYLAANPDKQRVLQREIDQFYANVPAEHLSDEEYLREQVPREIITGKCAYVQGVINEAMRLVPQLPSGVRRIIGNGGVTVEGVYLPEGCEAYWPAFTAGRSESNFPEPNSFLPERWCTRTGTTLAAASDYLDPNTKLDEPTDAEPSRFKEIPAFFPFWVGAYSCVGRGLAQIQMRMTLAKVMRGFEVVLSEDGQSERNLTEERLLEACKDCFTTEFGIVQLGFRRRRG